jgi:acyl-CoA thioesterase
MLGLARATELAPLDADVSPAPGPARLDRCSAQLSPEWEIWGPNGGYLATLALRAAGRVARIQHVASLHVHYLRSPRFEPVELTTHVVQAGQRAESIRVEMEQAGKPVLSALVRTALPGKGLAHDVATVPNVVSPDHTLLSADDLRRPQHGRHAFWENFERRVLQPSAWAIPRLEAPPRWREWVRYRDLDVGGSAHEQDQAGDEDPFLAAGRLALLIDTMAWPAAWLAHSEDEYIAPSLDLCVWFHRVRSSGWLLIDAESPLAAAGLVHGRVAIWSEQRELLASGGSQLLCVAR